MAKTAKQIAASRRNLAKARAARRRRRSAPTAVAKRARRRQKTKNVVNNTLAVAAVGGYAAYTIHTSRKTPKIPNPYGTTRKSRKRNKAYDRHLKKMGYIENNGRLHPWGARPSRGGHTVRTRSYRGAGYVSSSPQLSLMARKPKYTHKQFISGSGKSYRL